MMEAGTDAVEVTDKPSTVAEIDEAISALCKIHARLLSEIAQSQQDGLAFVHWSEKQAWEDAGAVLLATVELERAKAGAIQSLSTKAEELAVENERLRRVAEQAWVHLDMLLLYATSYPDDSHVANARKFMAKLAEDIGFKRKNRTDARSFPALTDTYCMPPYPEPQP